MGSDNLNVQDPAGLTSSWAESTLLVSCSFPADKMAVLCWLAIRGFVFTGNTAVCMCVIMCI